MPDLFNILRSAPGEIAGQTWCFHRIIGHSITVNHITYCFYIYYFNYGLWHVRCKYFSKNKKAVPRIPMRSKRRFQISSICVLFAADWLSPENLRSSLRDVNLTKGGDEKHTVAWEVKLLPE